MKYLLDTNCCIHLLNNTDPAAVKRFLALGPDPFAICTVVQAELEYVARKSQRVAENLSRARQFMAPFRNLPFDTKSGVEYGDIRASLERQGTPIGANDLLIGAIARAHGLTLLTRNLREFARIPGLMVEVW